jgi:large subunit ribosomal protein L3
VVTQIKNLTTDGYWAVQLGYGIRKENRLSKPLQGHLKKSQSYPRYLREVRLENEPDCKVGDVIKVEEVLKVGDVVAVTSTSKGKGFAGVVKRWHFAGGPKTHGQSDRQRAPGSIGQGTTPGRVLKGKHMAGRMGNEQNTIKNLRVVSIDPEKGTVNLSGPIAGSNKSFVIIRKISSGKLEELIEEAPQAQVTEESQEAPKEEVKPAEAEAKTE